MVGLWVYFILSFVVSSFSKLCEYKSENNFVSRIENPAGFSLFWRQNPDSPVWPVGLLMTWLPTLLAHVSPLLSVSVSGEPWEGALRWSSLLPKFKPLLWSLLPLVCVSVCTHPIVLHRTRLSPPLYLIWTPVGSRESPFLCVHSTCHSIWCLVVLNESTWKGNGGQREEQVEKLNESLINKRKQRSPSVPFQLKRISHRAFLCIYQWMKFWLQGPCSPSGEPWQMPILSPFFSSCFVFARINPSSSLLPQPQFLLHFLFISPQAIPHIYPIFQGEKMTIFS